MTGTGRRRGCGVSTDQRGCVVRDRIELSTFRFQVNRAKRCADLRKRTSPTSGTALGGKGNIDASRTQHAPSNKRDSDFTQAIAAVVSLILTVCCDCGTGLSGPPALSVTDCH
jgi:hypothetical protein